MLLLTFIVAHHLIIRIFKKNVQQNLIAKPNLLMGYRSFKSLKNDKSWQFAQQMFLKYSEQVNKVGVVLGVLALLWDIATWLTPSSLIIQVLLFFVGILYIIIRTEIKITKSY